MTRDSLVKRLQAADGWVPVSNITKVLTDRVGSSTPYKWIQAGIVRAQKIDNSIQIFAEDLSDVLDNYLANKRASPLVESKYPFLTKTDGYEIYEEIDLVNPELNVPDPAWLHNLLDRIQLLIHKDKSESFSDEPELATLEAKLAALESSMRSLTALVTASSSAPLALPSRREIKLLMIDASSALKERLSVKQSLNWLGIMAGLDLPDIQRVHELGEEDSSLQIQTLSALANKCMDVLSSPELARITGSSQNLDKRRGESLYNEFTSKCVAYFYSRQLKLSGKQLPVGHHPAEKLLLGLLPDVV